MKPAARLVWTRAAAGVYRCGNFLVVKLDARAGWHLSNDLVPDWEVVKPSLHAAQSCAASCAQESTLLAFGGAEVEVADVDGVTTRRGRHWERNTISRATAIAAAVAGATRVDGFGRLIAEPAAAAGSVTQNDVTARSPASE